VPRFVLFLLLTLCLLVQPMAHGRDLKVLQKPGDAQHVLMHELGQPHHHHADGDVHLDDSDAARDHVSLDCCQAPALLFAPDLTVQALKGIAPSPMRPRAAPNPVAEGPLRPPRRLV
jgi:hypothetical protein